MDRDAYDEPRTEIMETEALVIKGTVERRSDA